MGFLFLFSIYAILVNLYLVFPFISCFYYLLFVTTQHGIIKSWGFWLDTNVNRASTSAICPHTWDVSLFSCLSVFYVWIGIHK